MVMDLVQFQPGRTMADFFQRYGTDAHCEVAPI